MPRLSEPGKLSIEEQAREARAPSVTEVERDLVRRRLGEYRNNPDESVATLSDIKRDLGLP